MIPSSFNVSNNLLAPSEVPEVNHFERYYIAGRQLEKRIYTDAETAQLPIIDPGHPHRKEWAIRKQSSQKLIAYLKSKGKTLHILEVGSGNGWLSHRLASIQGSKVSGLDINLTELKQAERIFNKHSNLKFICGDILSGALVDLGFDVIVFAASIQYFQSIPCILNASFQHLNPGGEIHIMDSPFYDPSEIAIARQRSKSYYTILGLPELANYYFHHSFSEIQPFNHKLLRNPHAIKNRLFGHNQPFPWIRIKKD